MESNVDCTGVGRTVWLVKVPKYLADIWNKADSTGIVGNLVFSKAHGNQVNFNLSEQLAASNSIDDIPTQREHKLVMSDVSQSLAVFSELPLDDPESAPTTSENRYSFEGKVVKRADCRPVQNPNYMLMKKKAIERALKPARSVKQITEIVPKGFKPVRNHEMNIKQEKRRKEEGKRARAERDDVMEMLFAAFERHQYYSLKDLIQITQQPVVHLKSILKDICVYRTKNPNKSMWELKPEYRHYKSGEEDAEKST